jgi:hypothetical protein
MRINLEKINITFSEEEMKEVLELKGYKIEGYKINSLGQNLISEKIYAIPIEEEFVYSKHKYIDIVFLEVFNAEIKKSLLNFLKNNP